MENKNRSPIANIMILRDQIIQDWTTLKELISSNQQFHWGQLLRSLEINSLVPTLSLEEVVREIKEWQERKLEEEWNRRDSGDGGADIEIEEID